MGGSGVTTIPAGVTATLSGSGLKLLGRTLRNQGIINYTGFIFRFGAAPEVGTLNNEGVFNITGGGALDQSGLNAPHVFNNIGSFNRSGPGLSQIDGISFNNTGTVNVLEGTLGQVRMPSADAAVDPPVVRPAYNVSFSVVNYSATTLELVRIDLDGQEKSCGVLRTNTAFSSMTTAGATWIMRNASTGEEFHRLTMPNQSRVLRIAASQ